MNLDLVRTWLYSTTEQFERQDMIPGVIIENKDGSSPAGITFSTIHAFKGLEADAIILADLDGSDWAMKQQPLYVAASRAKHLLAICVIPVRDDYC